MSQGSIVVATAPVRQYQYQGYVRDYFDLATKECHCLMFLVWEHGCGDFWGGQTVFLFAMLHSKI